MDKAVTDRGKHIKAARNSAPEMPHATTRTANWQVHNIISSIAVFVRRRLDRKLINSSRLFDRDFYLKKDPELRNFGIDPIQHYLEYGAREGRDPSPLFHTEWYLQQYSDVRAAGINPLVHYLRYGRAEGRDPRPVEDRAVNPDVGDGDASHIERDSIWKNLVRACLATDPVTDQISERARRTLLFDAQDYLSINPDVSHANFDPHEHFGRYGWREGRRTISALGCARKLHSASAQYNHSSAEYLREFEAAQHDRSMGDSLARSKTFAVVCHSRTNYYMVPIARAIQHALQSAGANCKLITENDKTLKSIDIPIVFAPHEFFSQNIPDSLREDAFVRRLVLFNTEQLPSPWFHEAVSYFYRAKAVLNVNFQNARIMGAEFPATYVLPPFDTIQMRKAFNGQELNHRLFRWIDPTLLDWSEDRPIKDRHFDLFFAGFKTLDRNRIFIRNAEYLSQKECFLAYTALPNQPQPLDESTRSIFSNNLAVGRNTKIALNLHRYALGFFEWERMVVQGFACGACVVGNLGLPSPFFTSGVHYFETISRNVDKIIRWILDTDEGAAAAQAAVDAARKVLHEQLTAERVGRYVLKFLSSVEAAQ